MATPGMGLQGNYDGGYTYTENRYGAGPWDPPGYPHPWVGFPILAPLQCPSLSALEMRQSSILALKLAVLVISRHIYSVSSFPGNLYQLCLYWHFQKAVDTHWLR
jgi:hypothetical protein